MTRNWLKSRLGKKKISVFKYILYVCLLLHIICDDMNLIYSLDATPAPIFCSRTLEAYHTSQQLQGRHAVRVLSLKSLTVTVTHCVQYCEPLSLCCTSSREGFPGGKQSEIRELQIVNIWPILLTCRGNPPGHLVLISWP